MPSGWGTSTCVEDAIEVSSRIVGTCRHGSPMCAPRVVAHAMLPANLATAEPRERSTTVCNASGQYCPNDCAIDMSGRRGIIFRHLGTRRRTNIGSGEARDELENVDHLRLVTKVARLYYTHGLRQTDIAERLQISQSRVSRLLSQAEEANIVRIVVAIPPHVHGDLEDAIENTYGLSEVHVIDTVSTEGPALDRDLAYGMASILHDAAPEASTIGFTSWSRTQRQMVSALQPLRSNTRYVVETLGDLGPPSLQHEAAGSTQQFATLTGGEPVFLRTPGVVPSRSIKEALLNQDLYARHALEMLNDLDLALVGIGTCEITPPLRSGDNYFTEEQLKEVKRLGAVGQVCLRFLDADGALIPNELDDLVIGITTEQLKSARRRWAVAGGPQKYAAIRAALLGGWVDTLVTDTGSAEYLVSSADGGRSKRSKKQVTAS
jgi:DNA-binding transcriptional regulator LsrR (DeoR family)